MKSLTIYDNSLISSIPSELGNLQFLEHLIISGNKLSGTVPLEITMLPMLEHLWLKGNDLVGSVPTEICQRGDNSIDIQVDCNAVNCTCCKECM
jgi:Leucine-rich repeat (LRR) protein